MIEMKGFKLNVTLMITFKKPQGDNTLYKSASKPQIINIGMQGMQELFFCQQQVPGGSE